MLHQLLIGTPVVLGIFLPRYLFEPLSKPITAGKRLPNHRHLSKICIHPYLKAGIRPSRTYTAFLRCLNNLVKILYLSLSKTIHEIRYCDSCPVISRAFFTSSTVLAFSTFITSRSFSSAGILSRSLQSNSSPFLPYPSQSDNIPVREPWLPHVCFCPAFFRPGCRWVFQRQ